MNLPIDLESALKEKYDEIDINNIDEKAKKISKRYRLNDNDGNRLLTESDEAIAYALSRMPATYEAIKSIINKVFEKNEFVINSILDVGAGTGAGTWAIHEILGDKKCKCLERENAMIKIGKDLMKYSDDLKYTKWEKFDVIKDDIAEKHDLVITSYMINELPKKDIENVIGKLWNATNEILIIVEPGTPRGFANIKLIRERLIEKNAHIIAPCAHEKKCDLEDDDWCNFTCRVQRNKIHKKLKDGQLSYEDEKFSYIAFSKNVIKMANNRILRHPIINKGFSEFKICTKDGIKNIKLSKKDGQIYKLSKKKSSGDILEIN